MAEIWHCVRNTPWSKRNELHIFILQPHRTGPCWGVGGDVRPYLGPVKRMDRREPKSGKRMVTAKWVVGVSHGSGSEQAIEK